MKLNPQKCILEAQKEKFFGNIVTVSKIEANRNKIQVVKSMKTLIFKRHTKPKCPIGYLKMVPREFGKIITTLLSDNEESYREE